MNDPVGQLMEQAWSSMEELCSQLEPNEWSLPTDCPGWDVKDQLAHIASLEALALGRPAAPDIDRDVPHVKNDLGVINERELEARRSRTPEELLDEYRDVTAERGKVLASWSPQQWDEEGKGVLGTAQRRRVIGVRIVDVFTHEQDVRVATGKPGHMNGDVARFVFKNFADTVGFVLVKRAQASEGQSVVFEVGAPGGTFAYGVKDGRGLALDPIPEDPTVRVSTDAGTFLRLAAGRWPVDRVEQEGRVRITGDRELGRRILAGLNLTP